MPLVLPCEEWGRENTITATSAYRLQATDSPITDKKFLIFRQNLPSLLICTYRLLREGYSGERDRARVPRNRYIYKAPGFRTGGVVSDYSIGRVWARRGGSFGNDMVRDGSDWNQLVINHSIALDSLWIYLWYVSKIKGTFILVYRF